MKTFARRHSTEEAGVKQTEVKILPWETRIEQKTILSHVSRTCVCNVGTVLKACSCEHYDVALSTISYDGGPSVITLIRVFVRRRQLTSSGRLGDTCVHVHLSNGFECGVVANKATEEMPQMCDRVVSLSLPIVTDVFRASWRKCCLSRWRSRTSRQRLQELMQKR